MDFQYEYDLESPSILKLENVSLSFGEKLILRDINVDIKDIKRKDKISGQIVGFLGPSGRGKTQLFNIISGLNKPTTGRVYINGKEVSAGDVGVVFQNYYVFQHLTVYQNLMLAQMKSKLSKSERKDKANLYLERFKLADKKNYYPASLSGGQRQRVAIMQQLLCSERFLLLDEPFSGLDINMIREVSDVILEVAHMDDLNTVVVVSHDIESTIAISNELWIMGCDFDSEGKVIPGARIKYVENLMDRGLAWQYPEILDKPNFDEYVKNVRHIFNQL